VAIGGAMRRMRSSSRCSRKSRRAPISISFHFDDRPRAIVNLDAFLFLQRRRIPYANLAIEPSSM